MKNLKNKRTVILSIVLVVLLFVAYKVVLVKPSPENEVSDQKSPNDAWESVLNEVQNISFDTNITQNEKFQSLKSIETPLISLPIGRRNPFSDISSAN